MAKTQKIKDNSRKGHLELTVLSVDKMGRVITSGGEGFSYGILMPQYIQISSTPIPVENAIKFITARFDYGKNIKAKVNSIIQNKRGMSIAILAIDIPSTNELLKPLNKLIEGNVYDVVIDDVLSDIYKLSISNSSITGYIEKSAFEKEQYKAGDMLRLRLDYKGENYFQYAHFTTIDDSKDIQTVNNIELSSEAIIDAYNKLFSETERSLLPDDDIELAKRLIQQYPHISRNESFLDDLNCLYCRYDSKLEIIISSFNKYSSSYLRDSSYWIKYYREQESKKEYLLLFNSDDIVILITNENNTLVVKELYYSRTNQAAMKLLENNKDACLKLGAGKLHILNKYQSIPYGFSTDVALDYIADMQVFHDGLLHDLKLDLIDFRKDNAKEFDILKSIIEFEKDKEIRKGGEKVFIKKESNIVRTGSTLYKNGVAFHFDLSFPDYNSLVNDETEDNTYVSITDENGKPLRSGLLTYDSETKRACIEFPNKDNSIDSAKVREGFYLKKRNTTEHYEVQIEALVEFTKNRGTSFYDEMMSGSLPTPVITDDINNIVFFDKNLQEATSDNNQPIAVKKLWEIKE